MDAGPWLGFWFKEEGSKNSSWLHHSWGLLVVSLPLWIFLTDTPPPPRLKFDPLSQTVKEGDCVTLLCSAEGGIRVNKFHFYKDGVEITSSQECLQKGSRESADLLQSGSLRILSDHSTRSGEFACRYAEKRSNRWLMSSWSQGINVPGETVGGRLGVVNSWMWDHQQIPPPRLN